MKQLSRPTESRNTSGNQLNTTVNDYCVNDYPFTGERTPTHLRYNTISEPTTVLAISPTISLTSSWVADPTSDFI